MKKIRNSLNKLYIDITNSIAFYPGIIAVGFFLFSFLIIAVEYKPFMIDIKKVIPFMLVKGTENGRLILGTISGSIFSLMVFSFSMVMLVLNSASSTLSPRVIPGLITKKSHQFVLGIYIGTIIYSLILITNIRSSNVEYQLPSVGILIAMAFAITCLALFIYFIHSISQSIQVDSILNSIFESTSKKMDKLNEEDILLECPSTEDWHLIKTNHSGYVKRISLNQLTQLCKKNDIVVAMAEEVGFFLVNDYPFLKVNKKIDEELENDIRNCFIFYIEERVSDHYLFGFKQISEIAVKALSPGINDPGTAIKAIDMLSVLFIKKMELNERTYVADDEKILFVLKNPTLEKLLYINLTPIREYGKHDSTVMFNLLESLKNLVYADRDTQRFQRVLTKYIQSMMFACHENIKNDLDLEQLEELISKINSLLAEEYTVDAKWLVSSK